MLTQSHPHHRPRLQRHPADRRASRMPQHLHRHSHHHPAIIIISHHHRHSQQDPKETWRGNRAKGLKAGQIMGEQTERTTPAMAQGAVAAMTMTHTDGWRRTVGGETQAPWRPSWR